MNLVVRGRGLGGRAVWGDFFFISAVCLTKEACDQAGRAGLWAEAESDPGGRGVEFLERSLYSRSKRASK